ncbi:hypothetical protein HDU97_008653, partial [Phlyctochytrium planicorne]
MDLHLLPSAADLRRVEEEREAANREELASKEGGSSEKDVSGSDQPQKTSSQAEAPISTSSSSSSWGWGGFPSSLSWGTIVESVKKQSEAVVDIYKRDLSEFVSVVASNSTANAETARSTFTTFANSFDALSLSPGDDAEPDGTANANQPTEEDPILPSLSKTVANLEALADTAEDFLDQVGANISNFITSAVTISTPKATPNSSKAKNLHFDRKAASLAEIRKSPSLLLENPSAGSEAAARFNEFRESFSISTFSSSIARLLNDDEDFEKLHKRVVPSQVANEDFWLRYYFYVSEVEREEEARKRLMNAAPLNEEEVAWESDDEQPEDASEAAKQASAIAHPAPDEALMSATDDAVVPAQAAVSTSAEVPPPSSSQQKKDHDISASESSYEIVNGEDKTPETITDSETKEKSSGKNGGGDDSDWGD